MKTIWKTSIASPDEGIDRWQEAVSQAFLPLEPQRARSQSFQGNIEKWTTADLAVARVVSSSCIIRRTIAGIASRQDGSYFANLILSGHGTVRQFGRTESIGVGGIILVDTNEPFDLDFPLGLDVICVTLSQDIFCRLLSRRERLNISAIPPRGVGRIASGYIASIAAELDELDELDKGSELIAEQIAALLAHSSVATLASSAETDSTDTSWFEKLDAFIDAEISNPNLGAKRICAILAWKIHGCWRA